MPADETQGYASDDQAVSSLSFEDLYRDYATDVLRVAYFYLGDREKAEDITQDVFVKLMTNKPILQQGREKAWLLKVALNCCRDYWRGSWFKRVVIGHPAFELIPAPDAINPIADSQALIEAVNHLPDQFKDVVLLHYYQGYGITEIAEILGVAEGTVSSRLSRARKRLEDELKE